MAVASQLVSVIPSAVVPQLRHPNQNLPPLQVKGRNCEVDCEFVGWNSRCLTNISSLLDSSQFSFIFI